MKIRIAILDDKRDVREGLSFLLNNTSELVCIATFATAEEAMNKLPLLQIDVILLDIDLQSELSGLDYIQPLKRALPSAEVIMLTVMEQDELVFRAIELGATGYLLKSTPNAQLVAGIKDVYHGGSPISPDIARRILALHQNPPPTSSEFAKLSEREKEVIDRLARGYVPKEIATELGISYETVKCHCRAIYKKLEVNTKNQAIHKIFPRKKHNALVRRVRDGNVV